MTQTPQGNNPVQPQTPATNQQVPQAAGNPRFNTGQLIILELMILKTLVKNLRL